MPEDDNILPFRPDAGIAGIRAMIAQASDAENAMLAQASRSDPRPGQKRDGLEPGDWRPDENGLPEGCPVIPLGTDNGVYFFLDTIGQLRPLKDKDFGQNSINALFMGRQNFLYWAWPRKNADGVVVSWRAEKVRESLMEACGRKGPWNAIERARGRGAWRLADGRLAVHCGNRLYVGGEEIGLGELGGDVYMTRPPIPKPWAKSLIGAEGPAKTLLPLLRTWNWARPELDPVLLIGWIAAAMIGGALFWRPAIFMTGDKATGKSTLQRILKLLFGGALIASENTTEAGISQLLKHDSLPVAVDEIEGKANNARSKSIIELARVASSGGLRLRGGDNHTGTQFNARSAFAFSSINTPPLEPQDLSRMAMLRLYRLPPGAVPPELEEAELARLGRLVLRRMMDNWHWLPATLAEYKRALSAHGHAGRGQDTFGTLLACADLLIDGDGEALGVEMGPATETADVWGERLKAEGLAELEDAAENWRLCLDHILSARIEIFRAGKQKSVGGVLEALVRPGAAGMDFDEAREFLQECGLILARPSPASPEYELVIPNQHPALHRLFEGSKWAGEPNAGVWSGALRQSPPGTWRLGSGRVDGQKAKGTAFKVRYVLALDEEDA